MPPPSQDLDRFILRMPHGMRDRIAASAAAANRSMNAEILFHLATIYGGPPATPQMKPSEELQLAREQTELLRRIAAKLEA